ncbi:hypothetical protein RUM44_007760 [Polyplax serrata]|uniref:Protein sleepless n=1 Tax=Polyplax serrata TaxID=468196 RepID=A0ABR1BAU5_POLSC
MILHFFFVLEMFAVGEAIRCYNCYSDLGNLIQFPWSPQKWSPLDFVQCNDQNPKASNVWTCPIPNSHCLTQKIDFGPAKGSLIWRTCSNGPLDPCDANPYFPDANIIECKTCSLDMCNIMKLESPPQSASKPKPDPIPEPDFPSKIPYTLNINANVNLYVRR